MVSHWASHKAHVPSQEGASTPTLEWGQNSDIFVGSLVSPIVWPHLIAPTRCNLALPAFKFLVMMLLAPSKVSFTSRTSTRRSLGHPQVQ
jgi:hypothetical protein